jgi:hypothetical protein
MSGRQWQYRRKLPALVAKKLGKTWLLKNLGTDSLIEARRERDRINLDLEDAEQEVRADESELLADFQSASDEVREVLSVVYSDKADVAWEKADKHDDEKGKQDAIDWYKRVTGQLVAIEMNLSAWQQQAPVIETTQKAREAALSRLMRTSDVRHLGDVDRRLAGRYVDALAAEGLAERSVNAQVNTLSSYWKFLVRKGICEANPWENQSLPGRVKQKRIAWTKDEVDHLLSKASTRVIRHVIFVAALMGLRSSEIVKLKAADCFGGLCRVAVGGGKTVSA